MYHRAGMSPAMESSVDFEILARVFFSQNFMNAKFLRNKSMEKWRNHSVAY